MCHGWGEVGRRDLILLCFIFGERTRRENKIRFYDNGCNHAKSLRFYETSFKWKLDGKLKTVVLRILEVMNFLVYLWE